MKKLLTAASAVAAAVTLAVPMTASAAPAQSWVYYHCNNSYDCVLPFSAPVGGELTYSVKVSGGVSQPVAVALDVTVQDNANCHPTVYPDGVYRSFTCHDEQIGGKMVLRAYAGGTHDYELGLFI
ncbi:hypothetical protein [Amycolatopsis sp. WGS_07]|uniref:hypothetical protein n=1 Tax=Amycolatopsis sp. WGS_07 TaxID=3076764 RepID=UPI003872C492